eukprot:TRINITY_DN65854_c0_g1_i1.p3 TRINITY_DN65854_c0_g1~~TRINITY_DN65854_c0_g1_i1.p3  ORF type:complete len:106 (+),score=9.12 TRINITY_DN65854_c0_g1_i1:267-584(+)
MALDAGVGEEEEEKVQQHKSLVDRIVEVFFHTEFAAVHIHFHTHPHPRHQKLRIPQGLGGDELHNHEEEDNHSPAHGVVLEAAVEERNHQKGQGQGQGNVHVTEA